MSKSKKEYKQQLIKLYGGLLNNDDTLGDFKRNDNNLFNMSKKKKIKEHVEKKEIEENIILFEEYEKIFNERQNLKKNESTTDNESTESNVENESNVDEESTESTTNNETRYEFILGDCLDELKKMNDKTISLIVTSPPYNIGLKYHKYQDKKPREQYLEWIYDIFVELKRVLKDDGNIFLNMGYTNKDPWISMEVAMKLKDLFVLQNNITWVKSISIGEDKDDTHGHFKPINSDRYINITNENIYHFTKNDKVNVNREAIGVPYKWECNLIDRKTKKHRINKKTGKPVENKRCKGNSWFIPYDTINSKEEKGNHPATYPEGLVEHCINISDIKEGIVLDPFIGSGTTVRVVKKMNNNDKYNLLGIGIDIDEKYIDYCRMKITN